MSFNKICVLHLNQIGDLVFSLPLLKALRDCFPAASIHSVVRPYLQELLSGSAYINKILVRKSDLKSKYALLQKIRKDRYDLLISLSSSQECLLLTMFSKAGTRAGFSHFPWDAGLTIKENIAGHPSLHNNIKLLNRLNVPVSKNNYVGLINPDGNSGNLSLPKKFVVVSPGASLRRLSKTWGHDKFAELMFLLDKKYGLIPVLVGGIENREHNSKITGNFQKKYRDSNLVDLTGTLGLKTLCSVIKNSSLFVGIDSGVMHLASSIDVPVVGLFGPTDPFYVGPQNQKSIVVREDGMDCVPCYLKACKHCNCMKNLDVEKVFQACEKVLAA